MPTIFSHAIFASALGKTVTAKPAPLRFWMLTTLCSILPDADVIGFGFGIRYSSMLGHRGITHSIVFAAVAGVIVGALCQGKMRGCGFGRLALFFTLVTLSHPLLDMLTDGGLGVALFAPFSGRRYFLPWRPVEVSPIGVGFFSQRGLEVLASEVRWVWLPGLGVVAAAFICREVAHKGRKRGSPQG